MKIDAIIEALAITWRPGAGWHAPEEQAKHIWVWVGR